MDTLNQHDSISVLKNLKVMPDVIELHRGIDIESTEHSWGDIAEIKKVAPKALIAVAGGVRLDKVPVALNQGADILVVGRAITNAKDVREVAEQFINGLNKPEIDQFRIMTDF
jgi:bifunctional enzyme Fae/Hps